MTCAVILPESEHKDDERVLGYIESRLRPSAEALDSLAQKFFSAASPTPMVEWERGLDRLAQELARAGLTPHEIAIRLTPTPARIKEGLARVV